MSKQESTSTDSRWWEFYFVRYAMGTVIGALLLYLLQKDAFPELSGALHLGSTSEFSYQHLLIFAALGLTYCYIASTPLLVIHACRCVREPITKSIRFSVLFLLLLTTIPVIAVGTYFISPGYALVFLIIIELVLLLCQVSLLHRLFSDEFKQLTRFYKNLDYRRSLLSSDLRDSYKHLREHGNSIVIVVLEIDLAAMLYVHSEIAKTFGVNSLWVMVLTFSLWVSPAAFIYVVGHELEHHLTH